MAKQYRTNGLLWLALTVFIFVILLIPGEGRKEGGPEALPGILFGFVVSGIFAWILYAILVVASSAIQAFRKNESPPPTDSKEGP
jgi:hypothetical protein